MIERASEAVANPVAGQLLIDNLSAAKTKTVPYPDLDLAAQPEALDPFDGGPGRQLLELARVESSFQLLRRLCLATIGLEQRAASFKTAAPLRTC